MGWRKERESKSERGVGGGRRPVSLKKLKRSSAWEGLAKGSKSLPVLRSGETKLTRGPNGSVGDTLEEIDVKYEVEIDVEDVLLDEQTEWDEANGED